MIPNPTSESRIMIILIIFKVFPEFIVELLASCLSKVEYR